MSKYRLKIESDDEYSGPRADCDSLGIMACWWNRYSLGDSNAVQMLLDEVHKTRPNFSHDNPRELLEACEKAEMIILPIYVYEHGGITMSSSPFQCRFDSGQAGFIAAPKSRVREWYGVKRVTAKVLRRVFKGLQAEIESYDDYLVHGGTGYNLEKFVDGEWVDEDSCWGFNGSDYKTNGILDSINCWIGEDDVLEVCEAYEDSFEVVDIKELMAEAA